MYIISDLSTDHLETKKQIETIRERFGEDNWLHSHAGSRVQDVLGLQRSISVPSPIKLIMGASFSRDTSTTNEEEVIHSYYWVGINSGDI